MILPQAMARLWLHQKCLSNSGSTGDVCEAITALQVDVVVLPGCNLIQRSCQVVSMSVGT